MENRVSSSSTFTSFVDFQNDDEANASDTVKLLRDSKSQQLRDGVQSFSIFNMNECECYCDIGACHERNLKLHSEISAAL